MREKMVSAKAVLVFLGVVVGVCIIAGAVCVCMGI